MKKNFLFDNKVFIIVFVLIYFSSQTIFFGTNLNPFVRRIKIIIYSLFFLYLVFYMIKSRAKLKTNLLLIWFIIISLITITMFSNSDFTKPYFQYFFDCTFALIVVSLCDFNDFLKKYIDVVYILSFLSLFSYFFVLIIPGIKNYLPVFTNTGNLLFYNFAFINVFPVNHVSSYALRNWGIFREPGVFAIYVSIALIFLLFSGKFDFDKKKIRKFFVFFITLITTFSTAGFLVLVLIMLLYFFSNSHSKGTKFLLIFLSGVVLAFTYFSPMLNKTLFSKINFSSSSYDSRVSSIIFNIYEFSKKPLTGHGASKLIYFQENERIYFLGKYVDSYHNTNTFLIFLSEFGLLLFIIAFYGMYNSCYLFINNRKIVLPIFVILLIAFSNENLTGSSLIFVFLLYGYKFFFSKNKYLNSNECGDNS